MGRMQTHLPGRQHSGSNLSVLFYSCSKVPTFAGKRGQSELISISSDSSGSGRRDGEKVATKFIRSLRKGGMFSVSRFRTWGRRGTDQRTGHSALPCCLQRTWEKNAYPSRGVPKYPCVVLRRCVHWRLCRNEAEQHDATATGGQSLKEN